jgi:3-phosphoshikimate 1-carboxyvinyltransferase
VPEALVPLAIDECPVLFVAAACARGTTRVTGAAELRVKESDRIAVMAEGLRRLDVDAEPTADGMRISGGPIGGGRIDSHGDHRIAMSFTVAALRAHGDLIIDDVANVATSFPAFPAMARHAGIAIEEVR